jgi:hypothetical protein
VRGHQRVVRWAGCGDSDVVENGKRTCYGRLTMPATKGLCWLYMSAVTAPMDLPHRPSVLTRPVLLR